MYHKYFKCLIDYSTALLLIPLFIIVFIIIAILIKIEDGGSVFYLDKRIGKECRIFNMYKFRTMKSNSTILFNKDGSTFVSNSDERMTCIGKFLRETSIDEFPQIINVLKGEMSMIGPRPSLAIALDSYKEDELNKMNVLPGITGLTQAYFRNSITVRSKRLYDCWYSSNVCFYLDMIIIYKTINSVINRKNIYPTGTGKKV